MPFVSFVVQLSAAVSQKPCATSCSIVSELDRSPFIIFSTYFAIRSASRFTGSPAFSECKFVISTVCGMIAIVHRWPSSLATVKLIPSIENRSLVHGVLSIFRRNLDVQHPVFRICNPIETDQLADAIDVSLHDVRRQIVRRFHGQFQIDQRS